VRSGDRTALARAITLVESTRANHREQAQCLLLELMPDAGKAIQVGITGVPGVGKSTSIEALLPAVCHPWHHLSAVIYSPALRVVRHVIRNYATVDNHPTRCEHSVETSTRGSVRSSNESMLRVGRPIHAHHHP
jgi:predicted GTPase